jgi:DNA repair protein RadC
VCCNTGVVNLLPDSGRLLQRRLEREGPEGLGDADLLAVLLGSVRGAEAERGVLAGLAAPGVLPGAAAGQTVRRLAGRHRLSRRQATRLLVLVELAGRWRHGEDLPIPTISTPRDCLFALQDFRDRPKEHFIALYLNTRNHLLRLEVVAVGGLNSSAVHPRDVFAPALAVGAAAVIVAHNHPSGDVHPSEEDLQVTRQLQAAGRLLGIEVLDHLVLAPRRYVSLRQEKLMAPDG